MKRRPGCCRRRIARGAPPIGNPPASDGPTRAGASATIRHWSMPSPPFRRREPGTDRLEEAVLAYRLALQETTRERMPHDWAATQTNLGVALAALGERE